MLMYHLYVSLALTSPSKLTEAVYSTNEQSIEYDRSEYVISKINIHEPGKNIAESSKYRNFGLVRFLR